MPTENALHQLHPQKYSVSEVEVEVEIGLFTHYVVKSFAVAGAQ